MAVGVVGWFAPVGNIDVAHAANLGLPQLTILGIGVGISLAGLLLASAAAQAWRRMVLPLALAGALAIGGVFAQASLLRTGLLEAASVVALLTLWITSEKAAARYGYLAAIAISALGMVGGTMAAEQVNAHLA
jgi:hypothetical protein